MKKKKYLPLYYEWMKTGIMEDDPNFRGTGGLCNTVIGDKAMNLFEPTPEEKEQYLIFTNFWASGLDSMNPDRVNSFTELRQNIVLFLAAMNNEL